MDTHYGNLFSGYILLSFVSFLVIMFILVIRGNKRTLPGPLGVPLLGVFPFLGGTPYRRLSEWARRYGSLMTVQMGSANVVVVSDASLARQIFSKDAFYGRNRFFSDVLFNGRGFGGTDGPSAKRDRKIVMAYLKASGMRNTSNEAIILTHLDTLMDKIKLTCGKPFYIGNSFSCFTSSVISSVLFGDSCTIAEATQVKLARHVHDAQGNVAAAVFADFLFPFLKYLPFVTPVLKRQMEGMQSLERFISDQDRRMGSMPDELGEFEPGGFVDYYKQSQAAEKDKEKMKWELVGNAKDLYLGGVDSPSAMFEWSLIYLLHNTTLQEELYEEIQDHVGSERRPRVTDRDGLVLLNATICELLRCVSPAPLISHYTHQDSHIDSWPVCRDTHVMVNYWHIHHDANIYPNPHTFDPSRFIEKDGTLKRDLISTNLMPFSVGKRACPGEALAGMELFLVLATLIQNFQFLPDHNCPLPELEGDFSFILRPKQFTVRALPRH